MLSFLWSSWTQWTFLPVFCDTHLEYKKALLMEKVISDVVGEGSMRSRLNQIWFTKREKKIEALKV